MLRSLAAALSQTAPSTCRYPREEVGEEEDSKSADSYGHACV